MATFSNFPLTIDLTAIPEPVNDTAGLEDETAEVDRQKETAMLKLAVNLAKVAATKARVAKAEVLKAAVLTKEREEHRGCPQKKKSSLRKRWKLLRTATLNKWLHANSKGN